MQEMQETWVPSLGQEDSLEEGMATHCSMLAWRIPWTEEPSGPQSVELQRVGHEWSNWALQDINKTTNINALVWLQLISEFSDILFQSLTDLFPTSQSYLHFSISTHHLYMALTASILCCSHWPEWSLHRVSWSWAPSTINLALTPLASELSRLASQVAPVVKNPPTNVGDIRDTGSISESGTFPWRRAWQPTLVVLPEKSHGQRSLTKCQTWLKQLSMPWWYSG